MLLLTCLMLLIAPTFSQGMELDLDHYIQQLNLRPLNSPAPKKIALYQLGLRLFWDVQLSGKQNVACASCHSLQSYTADGLPLSLGEGAQGNGYRRMQNQGAIVPRHTPSLYNLGLNGVSALFWDGRIMRHPQGGWWTPEAGLNGPEPKLKDIAQTLDSLLAAQAIFPMTSPTEMLGQGSPLSRVEAWEEIMNRLFSGRLGDSYKRLFKEAFPGVEKFNIGHAGNAIAELERHHFLANNTPWDQYLRGNKNFMTERMKKGALLFVSKASCTNCHSGEHLTSFGFQNIGIPQIGPGISNGDDLGRMEFTQSESHKYRFRVAPLRNVALTAPYMHSGTFKNMWEVIEHYNHPMRSLHHFSWDPKHPNYREDLKHDDRQETMMERQKNLATNLPRNLSLTQEEKTDLYCFMMVALTDLNKQTELLEKEIMDEIEDCSPRI